jgi:ABC-type nickel/cobalt efflux system permease component RcnA
MFGLDEYVAELAHGDVLLLVTVVASLLGLRHATDPDHLTAVSTLVAGDGRRPGTRQAAALGAAWGAGHATTLFAFGVPIVISSAFLPEPLQKTAECAVGLMIIVLAVRLLVRWRRGHFHTHEHQHPGGIRHRHLHPPAAEGAHAHPHAPERELGRTPLQAYGIGLVHGIGGSAGVGVLLLAAIPDHVESMMALAVFAVFTAVSMVIASTSLGWVLSRGRIRRAYATVAPAMGVMSLLFGVWYSLGALEAVPYVF